MSWSSMCGRAVAIVLAVAGLPAGAHAQSYPSKPITIIVSLAAGTGMDTLVRLYGEKLSQALGQAVVIDNRPGSAGVIAGEAIAKGPADGYTLAVATSAVMAIRPTLFKTRPFDPLTDFVPISLYVKSPFVFIVDPALPVHRVPEFIEYAKERPGKLSYSSSGTGGAPHLTMEGLKQKFGFDIAHVPYRNSPQSIADVAAGHVNAAIAEAGASRSLIKDGKLVFLLRAEEAPIPDIPDVPSIFDYAKTDEQRQLMQFVFSSTEFGRPYVLPPGVPADRVEIVRQGMAAAVRDPQLVAEAAGMKLDMSYTPPERLEALVTKLYQTPPALVATIKAIMPNEK